MGPAARVNLYDPKTQLSSLVERAARGEEIVIAKAGRPLARLVAYEPRPRLRFWSLAGKVDIPDDFDGIAADVAEPIALLTADEQLGLYGAPVRVIDA